MVGHLRQRVAIPLVAAIKPNFGQSRLRTLLGEAGFRDTTVSHHDHHLAHAATAYFGLRTSPAEKYLVLTADGAGDRLSGSVRVWGAGKCQEIALTPEGDSLGAIYTWVTFGMGFVPLEHEYKLMGMGPYASDKAAEETAKIFCRYLACATTDWPSNAALAGRRTSSTTNWNTICAACGSITSVPACSDSPRTCCANGSATRSARPACGRSWRPAESS